MYSGLKKLSICFILYCISVAFSITIFANVESSLTIEKIYCDATLEQNFSEDEILIVLNKEASRDLDINISFSGIEYEQFEDLTSSYNTTEEISEDFRRIYKITLTNFNKKKVLDTIKELEKIEYIYSAEPNYYDKVSSIPNDYSETSQYAIDMMELDNMWDFSTGSREIKVGIIDTGINGDHLDLEANINFELSKNFSSDFTDPLDDVEGHGTHIAGIVGAVGNNNIGITGVNWSVSLVSLRVANSAGEFPVGNVIAAINYANEEDVKIDILNYSGGDYDYTNSVVAREQAIANYDGLFVCSAGNDARNTDVIPHYPSSHNISNLISVGALDSDGDRSSFSNYGLNTVDIYAPGGYVLSTIGDRYYAYVSGTSMAAPHVAGIAALLLSVEPDLSTLQLKNAIINSAETISITLPDGTTQNVKKLNAFKVLKYVMSSHSSYMMLKDGNKHISKTIDGTSPYFMENTAMIMMSVQNAYNYSFTISSTNPIVVTLYDYNLSEISISPTYSNGNCKIELSKYLSLGAHYLKINYVNDTYSGTVDITIRGPQHTHIYDNWVYYRRTEHIEACACGTMGTTTRVHIVRSSEIVNNKANCLECGHLLDLSLDIAMVIRNNSSIKYSINGSYIYPSGIVVLVDEDIDAYFAGTLNFYDEDEIPQLS